MQEASILMLCIFQRIFDKLDTYYLFNHVDITISYRSYLDSNGDLVSRLVRATLEPKR